MGKVLMAVSVLILLFSPATAQQSEPRGHPKPGTEIGKFDQEPFPLIFQDKEKLKTLLQYAVNVIYPADGFETLGGRNDFFHGHILYILDKDGIPKPIAVLYHTQEHLHYAREKRNWIQWLDRPEVVENAKKYERTTYPYPLGLTPEEKDHWDYWVKNHVPGFKKMDTIHQSMLDPEALGGEVSFSVCWRFYEVRTMPDDPDSNVVSIKLPKNKKTVFVALKITPGMRLESVFNVNTLIKKYIYP